MNVIMIVSDSFRYDNLTCYGNTTIDTPNLDKFAESAVIFENTYPDGLPTMPVRASTAAATIALGSLPETSTTSGLPAAASTLGTRMVARPTAVAAVPSMKRRRVIFGMELPCRSSKAFARLHIAA